MTNRNMGNDAESQTPTQEALRSFYEDVTVAGNQLLERVQGLIGEGNIRRLIIKDNSGRTLLEVPLTIGAVAGVSLAYFALPLVAIGAIAALVAQVHIIIERYENPEDAARDHEGNIEFTPTDKK